MDIRAIRDVLQTEGFIKVHATKKLEEFRRGSVSVYLKVQGTDHPLVVHGRHGANLPHLTAIHGVRRNKPATKPYHNSNMRSFETRQNTGKKVTRFGFDFGFESKAALEHFLKVL